MGPPKIAKLVHDCNKQGYGSYSHSELDGAINQQTQQICGPHVVQVTEVEQGDTIESLVQHDGVQTSELSPGCGHILTDKHVECGVISVNYIRPYQ